MNSKTASTEQPKAQERWWNFDLYTKPIKNDMSPTLQENCTAQWPTLSINQVVYRNVY